jgi:c-di-GMP-binding flagellar brake protein YcgR
MGIVHFRRIERRRTARVALCVDLTVHGKTESNCAFEVEARTLSVSGHGGMMVLEPEVTIGQKLTLINSNAGLKAECKVVSAKLARDGKRNVAFEFTSAEVNFWKMWFPAAGAKPARRAVQAAFTPLPATNMAR